MKKREREEDDGKRWVERKKKLEKEPERCSLLRFV